MRNFRNYHVWHDGIELMSKIYTLTAHLPSNEPFGSRQQMQRAAVSIPSNLAEGCSRQSVREFKHYIEISLGSAFELETQMIIADKQYQLQKLPLFQETCDLLSKVQAELIALRNRLLGR